MGAEQGREDGDGRLGGAEGGHSQREQHDGRAPEANITGGNQAEKASAESDVRTSSLLGNSATREKQELTTAGPNQSLSTHENTPLPQVTDGVQATTGERPTIASGEPRDEGSESQHGNAMAQGAEMRNAKADAAGSEDDGDAAEISGEKSAATETTQNGTTGGEMQKQNESKSNLRRQLTLEGEFEQLKGRMGTTSQMPAGADWPERTADMFAMIYNSTAIKEKPQKADDGYSAPRADEAMELLELFWRIVIPNKRPIMTWKRSVMDLCRDMHRYKWSATALIRKYIDQARLEPEPVNGAWGRPRATQEVQRTDADMPALTFTNDDFTPEKQVEIVQYCKLPFEFPTKLRDPTPLELEIVLAIMEGTLIARLLPHFVRRICDAEFLIRLQNIIKAQAEEELVGKPNDSTPVYRDHQSSTRIVEAVMQAVRHRGGNADNVYQMMKELKAAAYNPATRAIHFFFYSQDIVSKWGGTVVPFRLQTMKQVDMNAVSCTSKEVKNIWDRQLGSDGLQNAVTHSKYRVQLLKVSRFIDATQLAAFLRKELGAQFYACSMDSCGPRPTTSLLWELLFDATICPVKPNEVYRIFWMGHTILAHHVSKQRQQPCLGCGRPGHAARFCKTPETDFRTKNCIAATEESMKDIKCGPPTFRSAEEAKEALAAAARKKQTRSEKDGATKQSNEPEHQGEANSDNKGATKVAGGSKKNTGGPSTNGHSGSQVAGERAEIDAHEPQVKPKTSRPTAPAANSIITQEGMKWAKVLQRFRTNMAKDHQAEADKAKDLNPYTSESMNGDQLSFDKLMEAHGLVESETPTTGNCQYYALTEVAFQRTFQTEDKPDWLEGRQ